MTKIIDGKQFAAELTAKIAQETARLQTLYQRVPGLAVVLVGSNAASEVYVRNKKKKTQEVGMQSIAHHLPETTTEAELLALVDTLNHDPAVHGILVQLPLPKHIHEQAVIQAIDPRKDVDGFHAVNVGKLAIGDASALISCTPLGCLKLLIHELGDDFSGKHAVVIGRSNIVGKPMAQLLLRHHATVTIAHSRTPNLAEICRSADILVAAVGQPQMVPGNWIKQGATVIDVGINRLMHTDGTSHLVGDVDFGAAAKQAAAITPVPGGVGPMTIACLLHNCLQAAAAIEGWKVNLP